MSAVIVRPLTGRLRVHWLRGPRPGQPTNREMFRTATGKSIRPTWVPTLPDQRGWSGHWIIARQHLTAVAEAIAIRDGDVLIELHYSLAEHCDRRCQSARGAECTCACEGKYHGNGEHASWGQEGETTLITGGEEKVVTRLLTKAEVEWAQANRSYPW